MNVSVLIGLEAHLTLNTHSKLLSPERSGSQQLKPIANKYANIVDLGIPGTLPRLNRDACVKVALLGKALKSKLNPKSSMTRKHYFYFDMPKNYQITQLPCQAIALGGCIVGELNCYSLSHIHIEEDAAKHAFSDNKILIDYNRAGQPLAEVVTKPVIHSAEEAIDCLKTLQEVAVLLGISDCCMEKGHLKTDVNVSLTINGTPGIKSELKNMNSFKFIKRAIGLEIDRQTEIYRSGKTPLSSTLGYDEARDTLRVLRVKEDSNKDTYKCYIYMPESNLPTFNSQNLLRGQMIDEVATFNASYQKLKKININIRQQLCKDPTLFRYLLELIDYLSVDDSLKLLDAELRPLHKKGVTWNSQYLKAILMLYTQNKITRDHMRLLLRHHNQPTKDDNLTVFINDIINKNQSGAADYRQTIITVLREHKSQVEDYQQGCKKVFGALIGVVKAELQKQRPGIHIDNKKLLQLLTEALNENQ